MKRISIALTATLLTGVLSAQEPAKPDTKAAAAAKPPSAKELNIREYVKLLRSDVKKAKAQVMGQVMQLDSDDANKFWPIYKNFEGEFSGIGDKVAGLVKDYVTNYQTMDDAKAADLGTRLLDLEQERNALKRKYFEQFKDALGGVTAARFLQVENQLEKLIDLQIASSLPVM